MSAHQQPSVVSDLPASASRATARGVLREAVTELESRLSAVAALAAREVEEARRSMRAVLASVELRGGATGAARAEPKAEPRSLAALFASQTVEITRYCTRLREHHETQHAATRAAVGFAREIRSMSEAIELATADAELVALNAQVVASQCHDEGAAALAIAARMRSVATEIASSNGELGVVVEAIGAQLAVVDAHAAESLTGANAFLDRAGETLDACRRGYGELKRNVERVAEQGRARAQVVRGETTQILGHLERHDALLGMLDELRAAARRAPPPSSHGATGALDALDALDARATDAWGSDLLHGLEQAIAFSLGEITPIVEVLRRLNEGARRHVDVLEEIRASLAPAGEADGSLLEDHARLVTMVGDFVAEHEAAQRPGLAAVEQAREHADRLRRTLAGTQQIALEASVLGIATQVESARLGARGHGFQDVGDRLVELTRATKAALGKGRRLAKELDAALDELHRRGADVARATRAFDAMLRANLLDQERASRGAILAAQLAVAASRAHADAMRETSFDAVHHFQFQDRITQELRAVQRVVETLLAIAAGRGGEHALSLGAAALAAIPRFAGVDGPADGDGLSSGDLMLF